MGKPEGILKTENGHHTMDDETRVLLRGAYQYIDAFGSGLTELRIVVLALKRTVEDLGPEAKALYEKHYMAENSGPLRSSDAVRHEALSVSIEMLKD